MSLLTFHNPVFRYYAVAAALMIVKMMSQGWITVFRMIKVNGGFRYPADGPAIAVQSTSQRRAMAAPRICRTLAAHAWKRCRERSALPRRRHDICLHGAQRGYRPGNVRDLRALAFRPFLCRAYGPITRSSCCALDGWLGNHLCHGWCCSLGDVALLTEARFRVDDQVSRSCGEPLTQ